jgi:hypothetical protein
MEGSGRGRGRGGVPLLPEGEYTVVAELRVHMYVYYSVMVLRFSPKGCFAMS